MSSTTKSQFKDDKITTILHVLSLLIIPFTWVYTILSFADFSLLESATEVFGKKQSSLRATARNSWKQEKSTEFQESEEEKARIIADSLVTRATDADSTNSTTSHSSRVHEERTAADSSHELPKPRRSQRLRLHNEGMQVKSPTSPQLSTEIAENARSLANRPRGHLSTKSTRKTLILDLDETLIHSVSKGGTMSTAHMVEVRLGSHAILYYVHKRPFCDLFLSKVAMWYKVVIFTASVQEYADPVIDWLEQGQKLFKARFYRQHCTFRNGAYMKNLTVAEPDLAKAIIIDNSPLSYRLNQSNAIPIEGWISDPSDCDLLYLLPLLQSLRAMHDVRSLLSLRQPD